MSLDVKGTGLMKFLQERNSMLYGRILEVRKNMEEWLSLIPATFPHYTRHTAKHSDEIVMQMSKLLFVDNDHTKPVVALSSVEVYILLAAAYLHDAGMVISEKDKAQILTSEDWRRFISSEDSRAKRWKAIADFRNGNVPENEYERNFLADIQVRFLMAEFVRKSHHFRAADVIAQHQLGLDIFSFGDPVLKESIANACVAHGLSHFELMDEEKFPERRDVFNESVNLRFICLLLRIGDLLDMSSDRACPLLLNIACCIHSDSLAHWTKYQRITHRLTTPDRIEVHASCENQDEHRFLTDWCQWLADEVKGAGGIMSRAQRHSQWRPPVIALQGDSRTIKIEPSESATYVPTSWKFVLDETAVFERLVEDVYDHPLAFVLELVQNALDASRCQLYLELREKGLNEPNSPTQVEEALRNKYPIKVSLLTRSVRNELSGTLETRQVLIVEDNGTGMDRNIIENYLLQVGRSYYNTDEFRRNFRFLPASRFGIGFLSVFSVSDNVVVDTCRNPALQNQGAIRLTLTGPRNYLLFEKGSRKSSGTKVEVLLREPLETDALTGTLHDWCRSVEFPIIINELGKEITLGPTRPKDGEFEIPVLTKKKSTIKLKAFPIEGFGIEGELYVLAVTERNVERWDLRNWVEHTYKNLHPAAQQVEIPQTVVCLNGISFLFPIITEDHVFRIDVRRAMPGLSGLRYYSSRRRTCEDIFINSVFPEINDCLEKALLEHLNQSELANQEGGWIYKNSLINSYGLLPFWYSFPGTIRVSHRRKKELASIERLCSETVVKVMVDTKNISKIHLIKSGEGFMIGKASREDGLILNLDDLAILSYKVRDQIFDTRICSSIAYSDEERLLLTWINDSTIGQKYAGRIYSELSVSYLDLTNPNLLGITCYSPLGKMILNLSNPVIKWFLTMRDACKKGLYGLGQLQFETTFGVLWDAIWNQNAEFRATAVENLKSWQNLSNLPSDLKPASSAIRENMIMRIEPNYRKSSNVMNF